MMVKQKLIISVEIPKYEYRYVIAQKSRKSGRMRYWTVNGQGLYNATLHFRARGKITAYFHSYLKRYIKKQITKKHIKFINDHVFVDSLFKLSISLDIYEVKRPKMPDIGNMWLWIKWFEDALQESDVIIDDNSDYIIESGRKRYHWVDNTEERKLIFHINIVKL